MTPQLAPESWSFRFRNFCCLWCNLYKVASSTIWWDESRRRLDSEPNLIYWDDRTQSHPLRWRTQNSITSIEMENSKLNHIHRDGELRTQSHPLRWRAQNSISWELRTQSHLVPIFLPRSCICFVSECSARLGFQWRLHRGYYHGSLRLATTAITSTSPMST